MTNEEMEALLASRREQLMKKGTPGTNPSPKDIAASIGIPTKAKQSKEAPAGYDNSKDQQLDQIAVDGTDLVLTVYSYAGGKPKVQLIRCNEAGYYSKLGRIKVSELEALAYALQAVVRKHGESE